MPNILSLGFHFSKWEEVTTYQDVIDRSDKFTEYNFPVDYLWLDLQYTEQGHYLEFSDWFFPAEQKLQMEQKIQANNRRMVILADPHVKIDPTHQLYLDGV